MITKRIIPCLDVKNGKAVKGVNFLDIIDVGDPIELASFYAKNGADELVFLDITATIEKRKTIVKLVRSVAEKINIPFTVGGGISSLMDVSDLLENGADKISVNSSAVRDKKLISSLSTHFGNQCVVCAIDTKYINNEWFVFLDGGRTKTQIKTLDWALQAQNEGAGEILLTSMNNDGMKTGFAIDITKEISEKLSIPVIASGGAGKMSHFLDVFTNGSADAALAASVFHYNQIKIPELKEFLKKNNVEVRW